MMNWDDKFNSIPKACEIHFYQTIKIQNKTQSIQKIFEAFMRGFKNWFNGKIINIKFMTNYSYQRRF